RDLGLLLIDAVRTASIVPTYYSQVAAGMIQADRTRNSGRYGSALGSVFVRRGILASSAVQALSEAQPPQFRVIRAAGAWDGSHTPSAGASSDWQDKEGMVLDYSDDIDQGFRSGPESLPELEVGGIETSLGITVLAHIGRDAARFNVGPGAFATGEAERPSPQHGAEDYFEDLVQRGQVDLQSARGIKPEVRMLTSPN